MNLPLDAALDSLGANARVVDEPLESRDAWTFAAVAADVLAEEAVKRSTCAMGVSMEERQALEDALASELDKGIKDFVAGLDASIVEVARATVDLRPSCYNFLAGSGPEIRRNRIQAARLFPVLIPFLLRSREATALISAIDSGLPLIDKMVTFFGVSKSTVRHLKEVPLVIVGKEWGDRPGVLMRLISDLAPERRPTGAAEWEQFNAVVQQIARLSRQPVTTASGRLQLRRAAERRYAIAETAPDEVRRVSRDIDEFFERLSEVMRWELRFFNAGSREIEFAVKRATDELLTAHDIARIGQIAHRWQDAFLRAQGEFAEDREIWLGAHWLSPIAAPVATADSLVVPIVTASDLAEEGKAMEHCVASYACRCMRGESQIFSVRNHHGERMFDDRNGDWHRAVDADGCNHSASGAEEPHAVRIQCARGGVLDIAHSIPYGCPTRISSLEGCEEFKVTDRENNVFLDQARDGRIARNTAEEMVSGNADVASSTSYSCELISWSHNHLRGGTLYVNSPQLCQG